MTKHTFRTAGTLLLTGVIALAGCKGADGEDGAPGANGTNGTNGTSCAVATAGGTTTISCTDGSTATVTNGTNGINGTSCSLVWNVDGSRTVSCPDGNSLILPVAVIPGRLTVANESVADATNTADLVFNLDVKVDGVPRNEFTRLTTVRTWVFNDTLGAGTRTTLTITNFTVKANGNGNYTITMPGYGSTGATAAAAGTAFLVNLNAGVPQPAATAVAVVGGVWNANVLVDNQACANCHGENVFNKVDPATGIQLGHEDNYNPKGVDACVVCHDRDSTMENRLGLLGTRLMGYVHGIHNSHNMPGATMLDGTTVVPGGTYYRNFNTTPTAPAVPTGVSAGSQFSIGFPGYMINCSTCHTAASLPTVAAVPVTWARCMSCHAGPPPIVTPGSTTPEIAPGFAWAGFGVANTGTAAAPIFLFGGVQNHANFDKTTNCSTTNCHDGVSAANSIAAFHNGQKTERNGLIWDASDVSVDEGAKFALAVTGVTRSGTNFLVDWTATYNGVAVDPCNTDFALGPVFMGVAADAVTGKSASNMQFIMAFGQGDDWVNANRNGGANAVAPGQPATGATIAAANTTCAANVATSTLTIPTDGSAPAGIRAAMALQGKPQLRFAAAAGTAGEFIQARAKSPVFNYTVPAADGAATAAAARRPVVDTAKCLACHKGTLYQHGGNRVDNVDLCDTCHNPASSDQNNRVTFFGVTPAEAYDGKVGETYDMRTMIHSIHAAGENGRAWVLYRTRGIYFFGNAASYADVVTNRNWPTTGGFSCNSAEGPVTYYEVFGSSANGTTDRMPIVNGTTGLCDTTTGPILAAGAPMWQIHNVVLVEYPRPLNQCDACHTGTSAQVFPDPTKAVAVTTNVGALGVGAVNGNQLDDTLIAPSVQSCMTCHQSGDAVSQAQLRAHGYQYGWTPVTFTNGRADPLNLVQVETCTVCHGAGKIADFNEAHNK